MFVIKQDALYDLYKFMQHKMNIPGQNSFHFILLYARGPITSSMRS